MRSIPAATLLTLSLAACSTAGSARPEAVAAVGALVDDWNRGWKAEDPALAASGYSADAEFTNAFGFHRTGRAAIEEYLTEVFALDFVMAGDSEEVERSVTLLRPDVALVHSRIERRGQTTASGADLGVRRTSHLRVFAEVDGSWRIVSHLISDARATSRPDH
ncbi:MAG: SgcJ/EcaC family oxidoreductase [Planctomycetota bacterium]